MSNCLLCNKEIKPHSRHKLCKECKDKQEKEHEGTLRKPALTGQ